MEKIIWNDKFSVENSLLDRQHKQIINMINTLIEYSTSAASANQLHELLDSMTNYFRFHFRDEEKFMKEIGFPELDQHQNLHFGYIDKIVDFNLGGMVKRKEKISKEMLEFLIEWWERHILIDDMKYKEFFLKGQKKS